MSQEPAENSSKLERAATESSIDPLLEGWMYKKSRHVGKWRRRWMVLNGSNLYSFKKEKQYKKATETIDLSVFDHVTSLGNNPKKSKYKFEIYSTVPGTKYIFYVKTESDKQNWIEQIQQAQKVHKNFKTRI